MKRIVFLCGVILLLTTIPAYSQYDTALTGHAVRECDNMFEDFEKSKKSSDLKTFLNQLQFHIAHSAIALEEINRYEPIIEELVDKPEYQEHLHFLYTIRAFTEYGKGNRKAFLKWVMKSIYFFVTNNQLDKLTYFNADVGNYLIEIENLDTAALFFYENERLFQKHKNLDTSLSSVHNANSLGYVYFLKQKNDSACKYYSMALERAQARKDTLWTGIISGNLGAALYRNKQLEEGEELIVIDTTFSIRTRQFSSAINAILTLSDIRIEQERYSDAENLLKRSMSLYTQYLQHERGFSERYKIEFNKRMGLVWIGKKNIDSSMHYFHEAFLEMEVLVNTSKKTQNAFLKKRYAVENSIIEIDRLEKQSRNRMLIILGGSMALFFLAILVILQLRYARSLRAKNAEIQSQAKSLKILNDQNYKMFSVIAHDIRSPLTSLRAVLDLHSDGIIDEETFQLYTSKINVSLSGLTDTMENLLLWSASAFKGGLKTEFSSFKAEELIREIILHTEPIYSSKNIVVGLDVEDQRRVWSDRSILSVVLRNLFTNAIKFTQPGKRIDFKIRTHPTYPEKICLQVCDQGCGIDEKKLHQLLNPGDADVHSTDGTVGEKGTGLGIRICKEFSSAVDATISAESSVGVGTTFTITVTAVSNY